MLWVLYLLSRDPEAQEALYQDVTRVLKSDRIPTAQEVNSMPYLKAVIKETLRLRIMLSNIIWSILKTVVQLNVLVETVI